MKKVIFILLLIISLIITGCGGSNIGGGNNTYYVTVTVKAIDETTGLSVSGAVTIIENGPPGNNGGDGITVFSNILGNKDYTFITSANTYNLNRKTVHIGNENTSITISLNKLKGTITGYIVDEAEAPLSADVRLVDLNKTTISNVETGEFKFEDIPVRDDPYSISVTKTGYDERVISNIKLSATNLEASTGKITLGNTPGILTGRVIDMYSRIISNVQVRVPETNQTTYTDQNGDYTLQIFPGSNYTAEFSHADYSPYIKTGIVIRPNQTTVLNVTLPIKGGSIFGVIRNSLNEPVPGALISVVGTSATGISGVDGSFRINDIQPGTYTVTITHDLYNSTSVNAVVNSNQETSLGNIVLANKTGIIKGYVSEPNCTVTLIQTCESQAYINPGYFQFNNVQPGNYIVKIERAPYVSKYYDVVLGSGETKDLGSISMTTYQTGGPFEAETENKSISTGSSSVQTVSFTIPYNQTVRFIWSTPCWDTSDIDGHPECWFTYVRVTTSTGSILFERNTCSGHGNEYLSLSSNQTYRLTNSESKYKGIISNITAYWLDDTKIPQINFDKTWGYSLSNYTILVSVIDVNLTTVQYVLTSSRDYPSSGVEWITIANNSSVTINEPGTYYLHVRAYDIKNQMGYRCEGPFIVE